MAKQKSKQPARRQYSVLALSQGVPYYAGRVLQRLSLLLAAGSTIILWGAMLAISHGFDFSNSLQGDSVNFTHIDELSLGLSHEVNQLMHYAVAWSVAALSLSLLMLVFPRVARYEKRLVVDGVVIAGSLLVVSACSQSILQLILSHVAG